MNDDLISRQAAIDAIKLYMITDGFYDMDENVQGFNDGISCAIKALSELPSAQPEICEGCKHLDKWENEVEYGYPSPCTRCKRRVEDYYER